ncbi:hypothetical protein HMI56_003122 [Coelomomyces lativittatus]|nr:hypothetical protein HMI56_003122 [Coelomomyces lativittatus]
MTQFFFNGTRPTLEHTEFQAVILACNDPYMDPLTRTIPKPLLPIAGKPMIQYTLQWINTAGIKGSFQTILILLRIVVVAAVVAVDFSFFFNRHSSE